MTNERKQPKPIKINLPEQKADITQEQFKYYTKIAIRKGLMAGTCLSWGLNIDDD